MIVRHGFVSLSETLYRLFNTGSAQENCDNKSFWHDWTVVEFKHQASTQT